MEHLASLTIYHPQFLAWHWDSPAIITIYSLFMLQYPACSVIIFNVGRKGR